MVIPGGSRGEALQGQTTSTVVVLLSSDTVLTEELPEGLARRDPHIEIQVVRSVESLRRHLGDFRPDAVVLDVDSLGAVSLPEFLAIGPGQRVPTIVLDSATGVTTQSEVLAAGATSYINRCAEYVERIGEEVSRTRRVASLASLAGEAQQHYHNILEASSDGIFVLVEGVFRYVNNVFAVALGRRAEDIVDVLRLVDFVARNDQRRIAQRLASIEATDGAAQLIEITLAILEEPILFEVSCRSSVVDGKRAVVGVARDVTAVRALGREVESARLRAAQVERLRALGELAAGVAHDFNNTLGTILGRVELALDKLSRGKPVAEELSVIARAARAAAGTIQRIQEVSRPSGPDEGWADVDLEQVVGEATEFVRTRVSASITFKVDLAPTPLIRGNGAELGEVVLNLLNNAIDAVEDGGTVSVSSGGEHGKAVVVVQDDGAGMPVEVQQRIFEPFFSTKASRGTGLGLSVTRWVLRRHDAQIELHSEPGLGTRFRLIFTPFAPALRSSRQLDSDTLDILVVDDDDTVAEMVADLLSDQGHRVTPVSNAASARAAVGERNFDLAITDLDLPDMSGWQLARELRQARPDILVGLISGWPVGASEREVRVRGVDFLLTKPFTIDALNAAVARVRRGE